MFNYKLDNDDLKYSSDDFGVNVLTQNDHIADCNIWYKQNEPRSERWPDAFYNEDYKINVETVIQIRQLNDLDIHDELLNVVIVIEMVSL